MVTVEEGKHRLPDGVELYTKTWKPASPPSAAVVFLHGFSDHCNRYNELFTNIAGGGITVYSFDQRGWGNSVISSADKGNSGPTSQVISDITSIIESHLPSPVPLFLMGHSMGGGETLIYAAAGPMEVKKQLHGFIACAPLIRVHPSSAPNGITVFFGKIAARLLPKRQLVSTLGAQFMSHDEAVNKDWAADKLCHDTGTLEGLAGMLGRTDDLDKGNVTISDWDGCSIFITHGTEDVVTSYDASKEFMEKLKVKDKTMKTYDGSYHCIHLEPEFKKEFTTDVVNWIHARAKRLETHGAQSQSKI